MSLPSKRAGGPRTTGNRGDWDITAKPPPKKDRPPAKARSTLKPGKPMDRGKPMERTGPPERTTRIAPVSDKTKARRPERDAVRKQVCALAHLGPCDGPIDTHEIVRRSQMKEAAYMDDVTIGACRKHHKLDEFRLTGERIGIRVPVEVYKRDPVGSVAEAARLRILAGTNPMAPECEPSWWSDADRLAWETNAERRRSAIRG